MTRATQGMAGARGRLFLGLFVPAMIGCVALAWWLGFLTPEPEVVSLEETVRTAEEQSVATETEPVNERDEEAAVEIESIAGMWTVVEQDGTFAGYRADGTTGEAVGRTPDVTGSLEATDDQIATVSITVDMSTLTSDSSLRDDHLGDEGIEYNDYPTSTFVLAEPIVIDEIPADGVSIAFDAVGDLTVRGITLPVVVQLEGTLVGEQLIVVGSTEISLDDYGASVNDTTEAVMEFSLIFAR